jgi:hypothetical protein
MDRRSQRGKRRKGWPLQYHQRSRNLQGISPPKAEHWREGSSFQAHIGNAWAGLCRRHSNDLHCTLHLRHRPNPPDNRNQEQLCSRPYLQYLQYRTCREGTGHRRPSVNLPGSSCQADKRTGACCPRSPTSSAQPAPQLLWASPIPQHSSAQLERGCRESCH